MTPAVALNATATGVIWVEDGEAEEVGGGPVLGGGVLTGGEQEEQKDAQAVQKEELGDWLMMQGVSGGGQETVDGKCLLGRPPK